MLFHGKYLFCLSMQNLASLRKSIKTHTATCVCHIIPLVRMAEEYHMYKKGDHSDNGCEPAVLFIFDTGYYTVVSGWGSFLMFIAVEKNWVHTLVEMSNQEDLEIPTMAIPDFASCHLTMHSISYAKTSLTVGFMY